MELNRENLEICYNNIKHSACTGKDRITVSHFDNIKDLEFDLILKKSQNFSYTFTNLREVNKESRTVYIPTVRDQIIVEYLKNVIRKKYKIKISNRDLIIDDVRMLLNESMDYHIIKLDIEKFFPSINVQNLLKKIEKNSLLDSVDYSLLRKLILKHNSGVPQGLSISNYLSELYLELFDIRIKRIHPNIISYQRYVDDILIVIPGTLSKKELETINENISKVFNDLSLTINPKKLISQSWLKNCNSDSIDYLGYRLKRIKVGKSQNLSIKITKNKLNKIYSKINMIFKDYESNNNIDLLYDRLQVLTSKQIVSKRFEYYKNSEKMYYTKKISFGIIENYSFCDNDVFKHLDKYLAKKIHDSSIPIANIDIRNKFLSNLFYQGKKSNRILYYSRIPEHVYQSKLMNYKGLSHFEVSSKSKSQLINEYYSLMNIK